jgi:hypothetical protein
MLSELYRLVREEDGLEFLESAIVGGVAALAAPAPVGPEESLQRPAREPRERRRRSLVP